MRKRMILVFLLVLSLLLITGCDASNSDAAKIKKYIKENMSSEWAYSQDKLKVNDDNSVEIKLYNTSTWSSCAITANNHVVMLTKSQDEILKKIPKLTIICQLNSKHITGKAEFTNLDTITKENVKSNGVYYNDKEKKMTDDYETVFKELCNEYSFKELKAKRKAYIGKKVKVTGKVLNEIKNSYQNMIYVPYKVSVIENDKDIGGKAHLWITTVAVPTDIQIGNTYNFYGEISDPGDETETDKKIDFAMIVYAAEQIS